MRQIMTLFDEYQSKENAKHTLRAMNENARRGYTARSLPQGCADADATIGATRPLIPRASHMRHAARPRGA